jgi:cytochrome c oxidase assembly factor CtaG/putative copper export protein
VASTASTTKSPRLTDRLVWPVGLGLLAIALTTLVIAIFIGDAQPRPPVPGLPDSGATTQWLLPVFTLLSNLAATATVGLLLAAAVLIPSARDALSAAALRAARLAFWTALLWAMTALVVLLFSLSDTLALPVSELLRPNVLLSFVTQVPQGAAYLTVAALAAFVAVGAREADRPMGAWTALLLSLVAVLPPAITGHAASAGDHDVATSSLVVHIVAVVVWVGGLLALVWYARTGGRFLPLAASRFSAIAFWAYLAVGLSGVVNAVIRMQSIDQLWSTSYGHLVSIKLAAFVALGVFGWWHRTRSLPSLVDGERHAFARFATIEAGVMVSTIAVAVALSRSAPPESGQLIPPSNAEILLGFPMLDAPTVASVLFAWRIDLIGALLILVAAVGYARWMLRLRRRGDYWPIGRAAAWYTGLLILSFGTMSGLASYGQIAFSMHMTQHMVLSMVAPIFLVIAAPITLALRALPAAGRNQPSGPREWLISALHSPFVRVLTHPITALALFISAPYIVYFSGIFESAMRQHWAHELMHVHFILVGYLFYETLIGVDPLPFRASYPLRLVTLFASLAFHAFFAVALLTGDAVVAPTYYQALDRPWWPDLLSDQNDGSAFAWAFGEFPALVALIVLLFQWSREDDRQARRRDRQSDRDGDAELTAYNAMLKARSQPRSRPKT